MSTKDWNNAMADRVLAAESRALGAERQLEKLREELQTAGELVEHMRTHHEQFHPGPCFLPGYEYGCVFEPTGSDKGETTSARAFTEANPTPGEDD